ncbi:MAG: protein-L-isoaspartate(D-aspartate) O-methyltransferase [Phycisphaerales bacterium]
MSLAHARERMVREQIEARGVRGPLVLEAMRAVPREEFVDEELRDSAYDDSPLPIGQGQTISQPYIVALMIEASRLSTTDRVLEVGCGSGYAAAVMSRIAAEVYAIERYASLADDARARLARLGCANVHLICGDGSRGWREHAPYQVIIVSAGGPEVPPSLLEQLAVGGRLVIPVGDDRGDQELIRVWRTDERAFKRESLGRVHFVPLVGREGWTDEEPPPANTGRAAGSGSSV